jgi:hypothetical protein
MILTGNKDCDREILYRIDNEIILEIIETDYGVKICNEDFFRNYLMKNYPGFYKEALTQNFRYWELIFIPFLRDIFDLKKEFDFVYEKNCKEFPKELRRKLYSLTGRIHPIADLLLSSNLFSLALLKYFKSYKNYNIINITQLNYMIIYRWHSDEDTIAVLEILQDILSDEDLNILIESSLFQDDETNVHHKYYSSVYNTLIKIKNYRK